MQMNISIPMDLLQIDVRLRDIALCHASLDDMQNDVDSSNQFLLQRGYTTSNVAASLDVIIINCTRVAATFEVVYPRCNTN